MKKCFSLLVLIALIAFPPFAQSKGAEKAHTEGQSTITHVSASSITVSTGKSTKTYKITQFTQCTYEGENVPVSSLQTGMRVSVATDSDPLVANVIDASGGTKTAPGKKKKK